MAKQLNISLGFSADTSQAKQQIQSLQQTLNQLVSNSTKSVVGQKMPITKELIEAQQAAGQLEVMLKQCTNVNTQKLDLTKFQESLKTAGMSLPQLKTQLESLGPAGSKAFMQLSQSIMTAEVPLTRTNALLAETWNTLKNTARWQISSSILHGFMGAVSTAYGYAQDLDESLNNIRIVTGKNSEEMARFAEQANNAAKALNTTTTKYTDASLIYYQQGLDDSEVQARTDVTVKMANAAGQSAEIVSDQLTAIWNNFYDGSKSLEYYADVMTALGAATASSTDEIAGGLEKFAAIGDTIGLSYEYAASALATITSNTRQSEEVVGTALKTIFARIQGLNLGETLEDGVTLNKYSEALEKVGISIFDQTGELKAMDDILDEMANKWDGLSNAQQTALAQTVAGVRQYTQLIALMENWDNGDNDSMTANLATSYGASGTLDEQAAIYAEGWEAARDRVTAAAEDLYDSLLDEEFFIKILDGLETVISGIARFVDSLGGLPGILSLVGALMTKIFSRQISTSIDNMIYGIRSLIGETQRSAQAFKEQAYALANDFTFDTGTDAGAIQGQAWKDRLTLQKDIEIISENLTENEREQLEKALQLNDQYAERARTLAEIKDKATQQVQDTGRNIRAKVSRAEGTEGSDATLVKYRNTREEMDDLIKKGMSAEKALKSINSKASSGSRDFDKYGKEVNEVATHLTEIGRGGASAKLKEMFTKFKNGQITAEGFSSALKKIVTEEDILQDTTIAASDKLYDMAKSAGVTQQECDKLANEMLDLAQKTEVAEEGAKQYADANEKIRQSVTGFKDSMNSFGQNITTTMNGISSLVMGIQSIKSAFETLSNPDLSFGEKVLQITMSMTMAIPALISAMQVLNKEQLKKNLADMKDVALGASKVATMLLEKLGLGGLIAVKGADTAATAASSAANITWQATAWPIVLITLAIVAALAVLIATVALVVAAFNAWKNSTPEAKLAAAKEESARLSEELTKAKEASDALKNSIESYDSAVNKIKTLEKGTKEYRDAIEEANEKARELIETGDFEGSYHFNAESGLIEFDDGALENAQEKADAKVKTVQSQKLMADNSVLTAQNAVSAKDMATENSDSTYDAALGTAIGAAVAVNVLPGIGQILSGIVLAGTAIAATGQAIADSAQTEALERLQEAYIENGGNFTEALNSLSAKDQALIDGLGKTDAELSKLCAASKANTDAILQNNKQIIDANFSGNEAYDKSSNKDFLNTVLAQDLGDKTEELYEKQFKDGSGMTDKQAQEKYAKMMGWDANLVKNESGNKATYVNESGEEVTISDEQVRRYLAQQEALNQVNGSIEATSENITKLALHEKQLANAADGSIESYEEYRKQMHEYGKELGFTTDEINEYISQHGKMTEAAKKNQLSGKMQEWGFSKDEANQAVEKITKTAGQDEELNKILSSEEQVQLMVDVAADSSSMDEFARNFEAAVNQAFVNSFQTSASGVEQIMASAEETGTISAGDVSMLQEDENFQAYLEESGKTMLEFTKANYAEKMTIITGYYADLKGAEAQALEESKENYQQDLAEYQAIIDYKRAMESGNEDTAKSIAEEFQGIDFEAYMDMDISEVESKMDEIQNAIDEIDGQQLKLDLEWESTDAIEKGMEKVAGFSKTMQKDAKKVGSSYQLTAAQAKEWMKVYPELFAEAEVTNDGLISLNQEQVDSYIEGQDAQVDANIDANIAKLESRISELEAEKAAYEADLELAQANAVGKEQLETASAEYLAETRDKLTQYYIDLGLDEVSAQQAALDTMGLNEAEYSELVANAHSRNAENQIKASEQGATGMLGALKQLWEKVKSWGKAVGNLFKNVWGALTGKVQWSDVWGSFDGSGIKSGTSVTGIDAYDEKGNFKGGAEAEAARKAVLEEVNAKSAADMELKIGEIDNTIASIRSEIAYNEALKNQDLKDLGSTDPDEVDGSKGSGKDDKKDVEELEKILERYHEITREVEHLEHSLSLLEKQKDRTFGAKKVQAMQKEIQAMEKLADKQKELYAAQLVYLASDKQKVLDTFGNAQFNTTTGEIANYSDLQQQAVNELNAAKTKYNNSAQKDADKEALEAAEKKYEDQIAILEQYEETLDATRESEEAMQEAFDNWQNANAELLSYKLEIKLELNDDELREFEYYLSKTEDDIFSRVDGLSQMQGQMGVYTENLEHYQQAAKDVTEAYVAGKISQAEFAEQMGEISNGLYDNLESLNELDKSMMHYYGETLQMAQEEIDKTTAHMEHQTAVLDHYMSLMDIQGKSADYEKMGVILEGKSANLKGDMEVAKEEMEWYLAEAQEMKEAYDAAIAAGNAEEAELYKQQYEDALAAADEAQDEYLSKAEEYAESLKAILENSLNKYAQDLENALTGQFGSFDQMAASMERAASLQEEYLTATNKIYETNKLMNQAQQEIDKTSNTIAKAKLKSFIEETNQLQEKTKLSQFELEIQQAKYELLLAEIALEEAQSTKTNVRLQRDNEGKFGYVYTADANAVADAEQKLADAQNNLYNIGLEGANGYTEKYQQTLQEMYDTLTDLQQQYLSGAFESEEEYHRAVEAAKEYYYEKLGQYSDLYTVALGVDGNIRADAWSSDFDFMSREAEEWQTEVNRYIINVSNAFIAWDSAVANLNATVGLGEKFENLTGKVDESKNKHDELKETLVGPDGLIEAMKGEVEGVKAVTAEYAKERDEVKKLIAEKEKLAKLTADAKKAAAEEDKIDDEAPAPEEEKIEGGSSGSNSSGGSSGDSSSGGSSGNNHDSKTKQGVALAIWNGGYGWGSGNTRKSRLKEKGFDPTEIQNLVNNTNPNGNWQARYGISDLSKYAYSKFDTGGYTGAWGSYGKIAMLHEKELVLNKGDTENFLASMEFLDNIVKTIDLQAMNSSLGGLLNSPAIGGINSNGTLEQMVTIEANFPGVQNRSEIEEAFTTLINQASQYANRK